MALFGWIRLAIALWHFTVFLPDRFWAGIVGTVLWSVIGAVVFGLVIHGFDLPSQDETDVVTILEAVPGTLLGLAVAWFLGVRQERAAGEPLDARGRTIRP